MDASHTNPPTHPQSVGQPREPVRIFELVNPCDRLQLQYVVKAAYLQVFERDIERYSGMADFSSLESRLRNGELTVKGFIQALGVSELYGKQFYTPYPNTKVIELGTRHFLGRSPISQMEIRRYNQILAMDGIRAFISAMVLSVEYDQVFGETIVPYPRFSTSSLARGMTDKLGGLSPLGGAY